jgi:spermidine synthase
VFDVIRSSFEGGWLDDPRVRAIREDGRNFVAHSAGRYDLISLELGQLFRPGVATFYTLEFYRQVAARLETGGLVSQYLPIPFLTTDQFRSVVATFLDVFPHSVLWYNTSELLLIGSRDRDPVLAEGRLRLLESDAKIHADLAFSHWDGEPHWLNRPEVLAGGYLCGSRSLAALSEGAPLLHDDRPELEYSARNRSTVWRSLRSTLDLLRRHLGPVDEILDHDPGPDALAASQSVREHNLADVICAALLRRIEGDVAAGHTGGVLALAREAQRINPLNHQAHRVAGATLLQLRRMPEAQVEFEAALRLRADDDLALQGMGAAAQLTGRHEEAVSYYRRALELLPEDTSSRNELGAYLEQLGRLDEAEREFAEVARLDSTDVQARNNLNRVRAALKR